MSMAEQFRRQMGLDAETEQNFAATYSYSDTHIVMSWGPKINNFTMTVDKCNAMIDALTKVRDVFLDHRGKANV